jgi:hypothetical protein
MDSRGRFETSEYYWGLRKFAAVFIWPTGGSTPFWEVDEFTKSASARTSATLDQSTGLRLNP